MVKSTVVDSKTGQSKDSRFVPLLYLVLDFGTRETTVSWFRVRTSYGTFLRRGRDQVIRAIEKRIADYTFMPVGMGT